MEKMLLSNEANVVSSTEISSVPNGTAIISPMVDKYIQQYRGFARQTAIAIIGLANTLIEAESNLSVEEFKEFCSAVSLEKGGSIYKKMKVIGKEAARFQSVMDRLPNTWTTIYQLAKIDSQDFAKVVRSNALTPFMTAQELYAAVGRQKQESQKGTSTQERLVPEVQIFLTNIGYESRKAIYIALKEMANSYGFKMEVDPNFSDEIIAAERKLAA